ncbi:hypothetical protein NIES4073_35270 [Kalymmatonema gypsitolerans NIES-4073]|nr:hypothetical protein NIES4073_35270 [Scytonema sp. NIES-4073]
MKLAKLQEFRQAAYKLLGKAHDATFELTDAILLTRNAYSLADLSVSPIFRRKWPSIYVREACPLGTQRYKTVDHSDRN